MCTSFKSNLCTTIISYYSLSNANDETVIITIYQELSSLVRHISKHNILITDEDLNAQIGKNEINKLCINISTKRNREYLTDFSLKNKLACLITELKKNKWKRKLWTYTPSNNAKAQTDCMLIKKK